MSISAGLGVRRGFSLAVAVPLALAGFVCVPAQAHAVAPAPTGSPFTCAVPTNFVAQGEGSTQLYSEVFTAEGAKFVPVGSPWTGINGTGTTKYNAMGFNQADGYLYAISRGKEMTSNLLRIGAAGDVQNLGEITGVPNLGQLWNTGAFIDGVYYATYDGSTAVYKIDLSTLVATPVTISQGWAAADFTAVGGYLWGILDQTMYRLDPATGVVSSFDVSGPIADRTDGQGGAVWTFGNGDFVVSSSANGKVTQLTIGNPGSDSPTFTNAGEISGPTSQRADGASCQPVTRDTDLSVSKSGPASVAAGGTITWTLSVSNAGPGATDGYVVTDVVPAQVTNVAFSSTSAQCVLTEQTVRCSGGELLKGATQTITVTGTAPQTGSVANSASVVSHQPDSNSANNTSNTVTTSIGGTTPPTPPVTPPTPPVTPPTPPVTPPSTGLKPIDCSTPKIFVAQGTDATTLYSKQSSSSIGSYSTVGSAWTGGSHEKTYNAIAYNQADGYIYGLAATADGGVELVKIGDQGVIEVVGAVKGVSLDKSFRNNGSFIDGSYYFTHDKATTVYRLDLSTLQATPVALSQQWHGADFTAVGGYLWGMLNTEIYRLDVKTGVVSTFETLDMLAHGAYGAGGGVFTYANGNFGVISSDTNMETEISITNPGAAKPTFAVVGQNNTAPTSKLNDATSCTASQTPVTPTTMKPINCMDQKLFVAQGEEATVLKVKIYDTKIGAATPDSAFSDLGTAWVGNGYTRRYNSIAYNRANGYIYGLADTADGGVDLVKIGDGGAVQIIGAVKGVPLDHTFRNNGAFLAGKYYFSIDRTNVIYSLDINTLQATAINLTGTWQPADFTQVGGYLWGILGETMYRMSVVNGEVTTYDIKGLIGGNQNGAGGAAFSYSNGDFGVVSSDTGLESQIRINGLWTGETPTFSLVSQVASPQNLRNDGTSCSDLWFGDGDSTSTAALATRFTSIDLPGPGVFASAMSFTVTNTGSVALDNVALVPGANLSTATGVVGRKASGVFSPVTCVATSLAVGASTTCTTTFTITDADKAVGWITFNGAATASANGSSVKSASATYLAEWSELRD